MLASGIMQVQFNRSIHSDSIRHRVLKIRKMPGVQIHLPFTGVTRHWNRRKREEQNKRQNV